VDLGVLFGLPLESIATRLVLATMLAIVLVRALLRSGLRSPGARVASALAPMLAIAGVLLLSWGSLSLPTVMVPVDTPDALPIPVSEGYVHFAPIAAPLLLVLWAAVVGPRLVRRVRASHRARRSAELALREGEHRPDLQALTGALARRLRAPVPRVTVVPGCPGGACVVGSRRPVLLIDRTLLDRLDGGELEGVLAHELAHLRRRDNLVAAIVGTVRDLTFFIPGSGWALTHLHRERELAADQAAVAVTGRPGALASGLLKVIEAGPDARNPCAALAPTGTLVSRVEALVDERPPPSRGRRALEKSGVAVVCGAAVAVAIVAPAVLAGSEGQRDALALVWSSINEPNSAASGAAAEARAFDVYRRTSLEVERPSSDEFARRAGPAEPDERSVENRRSTLRACLDADSCPEASTARGLGLTPRPTITVDHELTSRWQATPVVSGERGNGFQVFWLERVG
jgi:Zn-dependent protease with chaperone function